MPCCRSFGGSGGTNMAYHQARGTVRFHPKPEYQKICPATGHSVDPAEPIWLIIGPGGQYVFTPNRNIRRYALLRVIQWIRRNQHGLSSGQGDCTFSLTTEYQKIYPAAGHSVDPAEPIWLVIGPGGQYIFTPNRNIRRYALLQVIRWIQRNQHGLSLGQGDNTFSPQTGISEDMPCYRSFGGSGGTNMACHRAGRPRPVCCPVHFFSESVGNSPLHGRNARLCRPSGYIARPSRDACTNPAITGIIRTLFHELRYRHRYGQTHLTGTDAQSRISQR